MNWIKKRKLPAIEVIQFNSQPYIKLSNLWSTLYRSFNSVQSCQVNMSFLNKIPFKEVMIWAPFSREELLQTIKKCNNSSSPGPDKLSWRYIKTILKDNEYISKVISIANAYIKLGHWPSHFKTLTTVIISKPNKSFYDLSKSFCPIVLLNILGKLVEKMIGKRLQFHLISNNFIHPC